MKTKEYKVNYKIGCYWFTYRYNSLREALKAYVNLSDFYFLKLYENDNLIRTNI